MGLGVIYVRPDALGHFTGPILFQNVFTVFTCCRKFVNRKKFNRFLEVLTEVGTPLTRSSWGRAPRVESHLPIAVGDDESGHPGFDGVQTMGRKITCQNAARDYESGYHQIAPRYNLGGACFETPSKTTVPGHRWPPGFAPVEISIWNRW